jgi:hypothetical protein
MNSDAQDLLVRHKETIFGGREPDVISQMFSDGHVMSIDGAISNTDQFLAGQLAFQT